MPFSKILIFSINSMLSIQSIVRASELRVFTTKWFSRFSRRENITDASLCEAVERAGKGLVDADLGGGVVKQRIARPGSGRSGGYRTILLLQVFAYGFAKSARDNIDKAELESFRELAGELLAYDDKQIETALNAEALTEVDCDGGNGKDIP